MYAHTRAMRDHTLIPVNAKLCTYNFSFRVRMQVLKKRKIGKISHVFSRNKSFGRIKNPGNEKDGIVSMATARRPFIVEVFMFRFP